MLPTELKLCKINMRALKSSAVLNWPFEGEMERTFRLLRISSMLELVWKPITSHLSSQKEPDSGHRSPCKS